MSEKKDSKICAILPIKNEENRLLRQHLNNLKGFFDEIVAVVDVHTTDNSYLICREYTDKVIYHEYTGLENIDDDPVFAGIKHAESEWIMLDEADIFYSDLVKNEISTIINCTLNHACMIPLITFNFGKWFTKRELWLWHFRIFRKDRVKFGRTDSHNRQFQYEGGYEVIKNPVFVYSYKNVFENMERINEYTSIDSNYMYKNGKGGLFNREINRINLKTLRKDPLKYFKKYYFNNKYYKENEFGYIFSILAGFVTVFLENAKIYELQYKSEKQFEYGDTSQVNLIAEEINRADLKKENSGKLKKLNAKLSRIISYYLPAKLTYILFKLRKSV